MPTTQPNILEVDSQPTEALDLTSENENFRRAKQESSDSSNFSHRDGRRWHNLDSNVYALPNDESEGERLDRQHEMFKIFFDGSLCLAPSPAENKTTAADASNPEKIRFLDVGTGTGIWAIECAEQFPDAEIIGIDISAIQPATDIPQNCKFAIANVEEPWKFSSQGFDYIHSRLLFLGLHNWKQFFQNCYDNLKPGGWLESLEFQLPARVCDQDPNKTTPFTEYTALCREAGLKAGLTGFKSDEFSGMMQEIGFENVSVSRYQIAAGDWAVGEKWKVTGKWMEHNSRQVLPAMSPLVQRSLGYTKEKTDEMVESALKDMEVSHLYGIIIVHIAQKPL